MCQYPTFLSGNTSLNLNPNLAVTSAESVRITLLFFTPVSNLKVILHFELMNKWLYELKENIVF